MRRALLSLALCAELLTAWPFPAHAQALPVCELFLGVSKFRGTSAFSEFVCVRGLNCTRVTTPSIRIPYDSDTGDISITGNFNSFAGLEANFNCCKRPASLSARQRTLLGGPRFVYRGNPHLNPFAHVLLGLTDGRQATPDAHSTWRPGFAAVLGGGFDVKVTRYLWVRAIQLDYVRESFRDDLQRSSKLSFGFVFRFGSLPRTREHSKDTVGIPVE